MTKLTPTEIQEINRRMAAGKYVHAPQPQAEPEPEPVLEQEKPKRKAGVKTEAKTDE